MDSLCNGVWPDGPCKNTPIPGKTCCAWHDPEGQHTMPSEYEYCVERVDDCFSIFTHYRPCRYTMPVGYGGSRRIQGAGGPALAIIDILGKGKPLFCRTPEIEAEVRVWLNKVRGAELENGDRVPGCVLAARLRSGPPDWGKVNQGPVPEGLPKGIRDFVDLFRRVRDGEFPSGPIKSM